MPTPTEQLLSRTVYATDGTTLNWDFSFSGGYLLPAHVKAFTEVPATGERVEIVVTEPMLIGPHQLRINPALASGLNLTIYRDTPKDLPLVDFTDESGFSEVSLDTNAKQAVFIAAETADTVNTSSSYDAEQAAIAASVSAAAALASQNAANASAIAAAVSAASIALPLSIASGGTGSTTAAGARAALGAAVGNGPLFMAYQSSAALVGNSFAKLLFQTEEYDTHNYFDAGASSRFTPLVAGYYQVTAALSCVGASQVGCSIYKNNGEYRRGTNVLTSAASSLTTTLVYMNGSTDYVEAFGFSAIAQNSQQGVPYTYFQAHLVRAA